MTRSDVSRSAVADRMSLVICTRDRPRRLRNCLTSFVKSSRDVHEIVVVDSSATPQVQREVRSIVDDLHGRYMYENRSGLSFARNVGINVSGGNIVTFIDDDFVATDGWDEFMLANFQPADVACCTGRMLRHGVGHVIDLFEDALSYDRGSKRRIFTMTDISSIGLLRTVRFATKKWLGTEAPVPWSIGYGFFALRRSILDKVGMFDEYLGRGTPRLGGEEVDMFYRILKAGYKVVYEPSAVVYHNHVRETLDAVCVAAYNSGASERALTAKYLKDDVYMRLQFFGSFFYHLFAVLASLPRWNSGAAQIQTAAFRGFINRQTE